VNSVIKAESLFEMFTDEPTVKKVVDGFFKSHETINTESDVCIPPKK
jgi:hypothetical protein